MERGGGRREGEGGEREREREGRRERGRVERGERGTHSLPPSLPPSRCSIIHHLGRAVFSGAWGGDSTWGVGLGGGAVGGGAALQQGGQGQGVWHNCKCVYYGIL